MPGILIEASRSSYPPFGSGQAESSVIAIEGHECDKQGFPRLKGVALLCVSSQIRETLGRIIVTQSRAAALSAGTLSFLQSTSRET